MVQVQEKLDKKLSLLSGLNCAAYASRNELFDHVYIVFDTFLN
jgi:hypothetical protein